MTYAVGMTENWYARVVLYVAHQLVGAAWNDQVDELVSSKQRCYIFARTEKRHRMRRKSYLVQCLSKTLVEGCQRCFSFFSTFEKNSISRTHGKRCYLRKGFRTRLEYHANHADRAG